MGGATKEEEIVATGSGSPMAYGVLEDRFRKDMSEDEAIDIAVRALKSAMKRDAGSGEGIHVVVITKDKYLEMGEDALAKYLVKTPA
jgi:proteasome beta subunit